MFPLSGLARPLAGRLLRVPARLTPRAVQRAALFLAFNHVLKVPLRDGELACLEDRRVRIVVDDLGLDWLLTVKAEWILPLEQDRTPEVTIAGGAVDFLLLASRQVDPDTLFFQRRLSIQGDTELGLALKNTLDALDWATLPAPLQIGLRLASRLAERFACREPRFRTDF